MQKKKKYKRSIIVFENNLKTSKLYRLAILESNNPKQFWKQYYVGWKTMGRTNNRLL